MKQDFELFVKHVIIPSILSIATLAILYNGIYYLFPGSRPTIDKLEASVSSVVNKAQSYNTVSSPQGFTGLQGDPGCKILTETYQGCAKVTLSQFVIEGAEPNATITVQLNVPFENLRALPIEAEITNSSQKYPVALIPPMYQTTITYDAIYNVVSGLKITGMVCDLRANETTIYDCFLEGTK